MYKYKMDIHTRRRNKDMTKLLVSGDLQKFLRDQGLKIVTANTIKSRQHGPGAKNSERMESESEEEEEQTGKGCYIEDMSKQGVKTYDKHHYCLFCDYKSRGTISKHYLSKSHMEEPRVNEIRAMPIGSKQRARALTLLRNEGNFFHNLKVIALEKGDVVVVRRQGNHPVTDYFPCVKCKVFIFKDTIAAHYNRCTVQDDTQSNSPGRTSALRQGKHLLSTYLYKDKPAAQTLWTNMREDDIKKVVLNDPIIRQFGETCMESLLGLNPKLSEINKIRGECRLIARLLQLARRHKDKPKPALSLFDLLSTKNWELLIYAAKAMTLFSEEKPLSLGFKIGILISKLLSQKEVYGLREMTDDWDYIKEEVAKVRVFMNVEWNLRFTKCVSRMRRQRALDKERVIPTTDDMAKITAFLKKNIIRLSKKDTLTMEEYHFLKEIVLVRLVIFNKRRVNEVAGIKIRTYERRPDWRSETAEQFRLGCTLEERQLAKRMDMVVVAGKSQKNVQAFVLIPPDAKRGIECLLNDENRNPDSLYIFDKPNALSPVDGCTAMRNITEACPGLQYPERIRSNKIRQYLAVFARVLDLNDGEYQHLCKHLGHDLSTHRNFYQLNTSTLQLTKVARLLHAVETGFAEQWKDKHLDKVNEDDIPIILDEDEENEGDESSEATSQNESTQPPKRSMPKQAKSKSSLARVHPSRRAPQNALHRSKGITRNVSHCSKGITRNKLDRSLSAPQAAAKYARFLEANKSAKPTDTLAKRPCPKSRSSPPGPKNPNSQRSSSQGGKTCTTNSSPGNSSSGVGKIAKSVLFNRKAWSKTATPSPNKRIDLVPNMTLSMNADTIRRTDQTDNDGNNPNTSSMRSPTHGQSLKRPRSPDGVTPFKRFMNQSSSDLDNGFNSSKPTSDRYRTDHNRLRASSDSDNSSTSSVGSPTHGQSRKRPRSTRSRVTPSILRFMDQASSDLANGFDSSTSKPISDRYRSDHNRLRGSSDSDNSSTSSVGSPTHGQSRTTRSPDRVTPSILRFMDQASSDLASDRYRSDHNRLRGSSYSDNASSHSDFTSGSDSETSTMGANGDFTEDSSDAASCGESTSTNSRPPSPHHESGGTFLRAWSMLRDGKAVDSDGSDEDIFALASDIKDKVANFSDDDDDFFIPDSPKSNDHSENSPIPRLESLDRSPGSPVFVRCDSPVIGILGSATTSQQSQQNSGKYLTSRKTDSTNNNDHNENSPIPGLNSLDRSPASPFFDKCASPVIGILDSASTSQQSQQKDKELLTSRNAVKRIIDSLNSNNHNENSPIPGLDSLDRSPTSPVFDRSASPVIGILDSASTSQQSQPKAKTLLTTRNVGKRKTDSPNSNEDNENSPIPGLNSLDRSPVSPVFDRSASPVIGILDSASTSQQSQQKDKKLLTSRNAGKRKTDSPNSNDDNYDDNEISPIPGHDSLDMSTESPVSDRSASPVTGIPGSASTSQQSQQKDKKLLTMRNAGKRKTGHRKQRWTDWQKQIFSGIFRSAVQRGERITRAMITEAWSQGIEKSEQQIRTMCSNAKVKTAISCESTPETRRSSVKLVRCRVADNMLQKQKTTFKAKQSQGGLSDSPNSNDDNYDDYENSPIPGLECLDMSPESPVFDRSDSPVIGILGSASTSQQSQQKGKKLLTTRNVGKRKTGHCKQRWTDEQKQIFAGIFRSAVQGGKIITKAMITEAWNQGIDKSEQQIRTMCSNAKVKGKMFWKKW